MIDHTVEIDISSLPKLLQNTISEMEEYEKKGEWIARDIKEGKAHFEEHDLIE